MTLDKLTKNLLGQIANLHEIPNGAVSIRKNGKTEVLKSTPNIEIIKKENAYEENKELLDSLESKLKHNTEAELDKFRDDVSEILAAEIVKRYYFSKGEAEQFLKTDETLDLSIEILNDPKRYNEILKGK